MCVRREAGWQWAEAPHTGQTGNMVQNVGAPPTSAAEITIALHPIAGRPKSEVLNSRLTARPL